MLDENPDALSLREVLQRESLFAVGSTPGADAPVAVMLLIGPEGGWTQEERNWAERYGVEAVGLGKRILRTETAALVATTILSWEAGDI